jgi:hypothetical protein
MAYSGVTKMKEDLNPVFLWKGIKVDLVSYMVISVECQQVKVEHRHPTGFLQPHAIPESKWEVILMDFIVGFPLMARRHDSIFVVDDTLTKNAHFILVCTMCQALNIARVVFSEIVKLHGITRRIISNHGLVFKGRFWTSFQEALGAKPNFSSTHHPETDRK